MDVIPEVLNKSGLPGTPLQKAAAAQQYGVDMLLSGAAAVPPAPEIDRAELIRQRSAQRLNERKEATAKQPSLLDSIKTSIGGMPRDVYEAAIGPRVNNTDSSWDVGTKREEFTAKYPSHLWPSFEHTRSAEEYTALVERYKANEERARVKAAHPWASFGTELIVDPLNLLFGLGVVVKAGQAVKALGVSKIAASLAAGVAEGTFVAGQVTAEQMLTSGELTTPETIAAAFFGVSAISAGLTRYALRKEIQGIASNTLRTAERQENFTFNLPADTGPEFTMTPGTVGRNLDHDQPTLTQAATPEPYVGTVPDTPRLDPNVAALEQQATDFRIGQASARLSAELAEEAQQFIRDFSKKGLAGELTQDEIAGASRVVMGPPPFRPTAEATPESALADAGAAFDHARDAAISDLRYKSQSDVTLDIISRSRDDWLSKVERLSDRSRKWLDQGALGSLRNKLSGFDYLLSSKSDVMKSVVTSIAESTNGIAREITSNVAVNKVSFDRILRGHYSKGTQEYHGWLKRTGKGGMITKVFGGEVEAEYNMLLRQELEARDALNSAPPSTWREADAKRWETLDPEIKRHADHIDAGGAAAVKLMQEQGMDVAHLAGRRGYVPRILDGAKLASMNNHAAKAFRATLARRIKELFDENADILRAEGNAEARSITEANASALAAEMVGRAERAEAGIGGSTIALFDRAGRDELENILTGAGMDREEVSRIFNMLDKRLNSYTASNRMKGRMDLDVLKEDEQTGLRLIDFYDNDLSKIMTRYSEEMSGRAALEPTGLGNKNSMEQIRQAIEVEGKVTGEDLKKELEELEFMFDQFLGRVPAGQQRNPIVNAVLQMAPLQMLGQVGWFAQAAETSVGAGRLGIASALKGVPAMGRLIVRGRENAFTGAEKKMLEDINVYLGPIGESFRTHRPSTDVREALLSKSDIANTIDRGLKGGQHINNYLSGMYLVSEVQQKLFAAVGAKNMAAELMQSTASLRKLKEAAGDSSEKLTALSKEGVLSRRLKDAGFSEESMTRYLEEFKKHAKDEQGVLLYNKDTDTFRSDAIWDLGFQQWGDQKLAREFMGNLERLTGQNIQRDFVGETSKWMYGDLARLGMSMRGYGIKSINKQVIRNAFIADAVSAYTFAYSSAMSTLMYTARTYVNSIGREDQDEFLEKRLSNDALVRGMLMYHAYGNVIPDLAAAPMSWYRSEEESVGMGRGMQAGGAIEVLLPGATPVTRLYNLLGDLGNAATGVLQGDDREVMTPYKVRQHVQALAGNNFVTVLGLNLLLDDSQ